MRSPELTALTKGNRGTTRRDRGHQQPSANTKTTNDQAGSPSQDQPRRLDGNHTGQAGVVVEAPPHIGGSLPSDPIRPLMSYGVTRTANTPQERVRSFEKAALLALPFRVFGRCVASSWLESMLVFVALRSNKGDRSESRTRTCHYV